MFPCDQVYLHEQSDIALVRDLGFVVSPGVHSLAATSLNNVSIQWRIEDFPEWGPTLEFGLKPYYLVRFFAENCMNMTKPGPSAPHLDPPMVYLHLRNFLSTSPKMKRYLCDNVVYLSNVGTNTYPEFMALHIMVCGLQWSGNSDVLDLLK